MFKKGIIDTLSYYGICCVIFVAMTLLLDEPRHSPGLNYIFLFLLLIVCTGLIINNLLNILIKKKREYNIGSIIIHTSYGIGLIAWYLIGYYRQFE